MDSTLRPKAAAKRMKSKLRSIVSNKTAEKSTSSVKLPTKQLAKASPETLAGRLVSRESELNSPDVPVAPTWSQLQNPYLNRPSLSWAEFQVMDRRVFLLLKGASPHEKSPQDWTDVKKVLFDEGVITFDELNSREGTELLQNRYESVRLGLHNFFGKKPEPGNKPEPVNRRFWTEGFHVYSMKQGSKYWKHQKHSVVEETKTSSSSNILGSSYDVAKDMKRLNGQGASYSIADGQVGNEVKVPKDKQNVQNKETYPQQSKLKQEADFERTRFVGGEDHGDLGVIIETENTLVESMRGEHVSSSIMSDAALEELLSPVEQYLMEEYSREFTADLVSGNARISGHAGTILADLDKTLDGLSYVVKAPHWTPLLILDWPKLSHSARKIKRRM